MVSRNISHLTRVFDPVGAEDTVRNVRRCRGIAESVSTIGSRDMKFSSTGSVIVLIICYVLRSLEIAITLFPSVFNPVGQSPTPLRTRVKGDFLVASVCDGQRSARPSASP